MSQVALIEKSNTENINIVSDGNYRLNLPDGTQVSPVYAGWENDVWMIREIEFDSNIPTYLKSVTMGSNTGEGYVANDILTISGGTSTGNVAQIQVYTIGSNGIVTGLIVDNSGYYTVSPDDNNTPTGGTGTGVMVNLQMMPHNILNKNYVWNVNTNMVIDTNIYETPVIDNDVSIELQRQNTLNADSGNQNLKDKLANATSAQIDTWLLNNVTDLASARAVLGSIVKFLAGKFTKGISL